MPSASEFFKDIEPKTKAPSASAFLADLEPSKKQGKPSIPEIMGSRAVETFRATSDIPTTALMTGVRGGLELIKRGKAKLPDSGQIAGSLGEKGIPVPLAATVGAISGLAKTYAPETETELALQAGGLTIVPNAVKGYISRVAPTLTEFLFPDVGKFGAQALGKSAQRVAKIAGMGKEGAAREEIASVNKVRAGVGSVLRDARKKFGETKQSIIIKSKNPKVDVTPLAASTVKSLTKFNFIPELESAGVVNPKAASVARAVLNDVEEFSTRPDGGVTVSELMKFRENLNGLLFRTRLSDQARGALLDIKTALDSQLNQGLGPELFSIYGKANAAFGSVASKFEELNRLVSKTGAAKRISKEVEDKTELGLKLVDFLKDAKSIDDLSLTVGARRFTGDVFENLAAGSSAPFLARLYRFGTLAPGAGIAGRAGLPTTPIGVARFGASVERTAPKLFGAGTVAASPLFRKKEER